MTVAAEVWKGRQRRLNAFTGKYLRGVGPIKEDGSIGPATVKRIKECKFWLGWVKTPGDWTAQFDNEMAHPFDWHRSSKATVRRGIQRRKTHNAYHWKSYLKPGVTTFDGVRVAKCAVPILQWCRAHGWKGRLVSGYRDPHYSQSLCYKMCGQPTCPGRCAGLTSNHCGNSPARFAVDVSDYGDFKRIVATCPLKPHIWNNLPIDPVHFSPSGN